MHANENCLSPPTPRRDSNPRLADFNWQLQISQWHKCCVNSYKAFLSDDVIVKPYNELINPLPPKKPEIISNSHKKAQQKLIYLFCVLCNIQITYMYLPWIKLRKILSIHLNLKIRSTAEHMPMFSFYRHFIILSTPECFIRMINARNQSRMKLTFLAHKDGASSVGEMTNGL
jgi:hypothetical protein